jgi:hypothetical protein
MLEILLMLLLSAGTVRARPYRGSNRWEVVLCRPSDVPLPAAISATYTKAFYQSMVRAIASFPLYPEATFYLPALSVLYRFLATLMAL